VSEAARAGLERLHGWRAEFVEFLQTLVAAESPSTVPDSQAEVRAHLARALESVGLDVEYIEGERTGGHLLASAVGSNDVR